MFEPNTTYADKGDIVVFQFYPTNHSVVRGEYVSAAACGQADCNPCIPYEQYHPDRQGLSSGNILTQVLPGRAKVLRPSLRRRSQQLTARFSSGRHIQHYDQ